ANLADILERVLDRGLVIAGDIQINLLDIELLTIKLRLIIASVETAQEIGIDWWKTDPWLVSDQRDLREENRKLRRRLEALESGRDSERPIEAHSERADEFTDESSDKARRSRERDERED